MAVRVQPRMMMGDAARNTMLTRALNLRWETVAYLVILVIAIFTRFYALGDRVMSHDESLHVYYSHKLYENGDFQHTPLMHGPILFHATALSYFLFDDNDFTGRIYTSLLGVIMVMMPLLFRRWLGRWGAVLASVMFLISPFLLYYHRYIREDTPSIVATLLMVYAILMYVDGPLGLRRKARWLYLFSAALLWNLASKEVAFMYAAIFFLFLSIFFVMRFWQHWRKTPTRSGFYIIMLGFLVGGVAALAMYVVVNIALPLSLFPSLEERLRYLQEQIPLFTSGSGLEFQAFILWTVIVFGAIVALLTITGLYAFFRGEARFRLREVVLIVLFTLAIVMLLLVVEELSFLSSRNPSGLEGDQIREVQAGLNYAPIIGMYVVAIAMIGLAVYSRAAGWWRTLHRFAELDLMILLATLVLPWAVAFPIKLTGAIATDYTSEGITRAVLAIVPLFAISIAVGVAWNWKRWLIAALVFHLPFVFFYTTMFTNPNGLATGMVGSLGYWLEQQGDRRGSQPQYYYHMLMGFYEFLPVIGAFLAMIAGLIAFWRFRRDRIREADAPIVLRTLAPVSILEGVEEPKIKRQMDDEASDAIEAGVIAAGERRFQRYWGADRLRRLPFLMFVAFWAIYIFIAYTLAGEKMPWLSTHLTTPLIFLAAHYFGRIFERIEPVRFVQRGWLYLILIPIVFVAVFQAVSPFLTGQNPFNGLQTQDLQALFRWVATLLVAGVVIGVILWVRRQTGGLHLRQMITAALFVGLSVLTFRAAWVASFVNYDLPTEFLVYAHGAPGVKRMIAQIEEISQRTTDGLNIAFAWGGNAWPTTWYFRDLENATFFAENPTYQQIQNSAAIYASADIVSRVQPLLDERYTEFKYMRMWWPMQDYFNLTPDRVRNAFDFSAENPNAGEIRRGMFDIWWSRDYTRYGQAVGQNYSLQSWPVSEELYFYVRKDIAAQIWNLGTGDGTVLNPLVDTSVNVCAANWQRRAADVLFSDANGGQNPLSRPIDIQISTDGREAIVAEEGAGRISFFDAETGLYLRSITGNGASPFQRPNGVAVNADSVVVADTWNYRVQRFTLDGTFAAGWGQDGRFGIEAPLEPFDGFWAPRDVGVDAAGNVYVSDTGNKRVRMFTADGVFIRDIATGGSQEGQLDEPAGLAIHPDGRLFVADTWNRRISVFNTLDGAFLYSFRVRGWYNDLGNRPYVAIDAARNLLYVTDPDAARVLVLDLQGNCIGSFGEPADNPSGGSQFRTIGGVAVDGQGRVYVTDMTAGRALRFAPFTEEGVVEAAPPPGMIFEQVIVGESVETTAEATPELVEPPPADTTDEPASGEPASGN